MPIAFFKDCMPNIHLSTWFKKSITACAFVLCSQHVLSHPHAWIDTNTYINGTDTHITSLQMTWTFDEDTSLYMLQGEDTSPEHLQATLQKLANGVVKNMYNEHYFTYFYQQGAPLRYKAARYPELIQQGEKLTLRFEIPLSQPVAFADNEFKLFIYDATYYVDMSWLKSSDIQLSDTLAKHCQGELVYPNVSQGERDYALTLAADVAPDHDLGERFSQRFKLSCQ